MIVTKWQEGSARQIVVWLSRWLCETLQMGEMKRYRDPTVPKQ
jgi:hypothetical protein